MVNNFFPISLNICFGCSKEPSHWDGSFDYTQHMFLSRNKKNIFFIMHSYLKTYYAIDNLPMLRLFACEVFGSGVEITNFDTMYM